MKNIEEFEDKIIRINNIFSASHYIKIREVIEKIPFRKKESSEYKCSYICLKEEKYNKLYILLEAYLEHIKIADIIGNHLGEEVVMSGITEIVKIQRNDFLKTHIDDYNMHQAVIHMDSGETEKGGELQIKNHAISPKENSIIIFPGKTPHSVNTYIGDTPRISISLGFTAV